MRWDFLTWDFMRWVVSLCNRRTVIIVPVNNKTDVAYGRRRSAAADPSLMVALLSGAIVGAIGLGYYLGYRDVDLWGAIFVPIVLCLFTIPLIRVLEARHSSGLANIVTVALIAKMVGAYMRYLLAYHVYGGNDSGRYHEAGVRIADEYLNGQRSIGSLLPTSYGTPFIEELNGIVALLTGRSLLASFMVFSWLGFFGLWAFVAAIRRAVPGVDIRRYAILVFFMPSSLFWPSSLGKEAWMLFGLGLFATGAARVFTQQSRGLLFLGAGVVATGMVRPHVTVIALSAFTLAFIFVRGRRGRSLSPLLTLVTVASIAGAAAFASGPLEQLLPRSDEGFSAVLEATGERTSQGGSEIEVSTPNSPLEYPQAFLTVMFRPLPFEVRTFTQFLSSLESAALLTLVIIWRRRIFGAISQILSDPYLRFAILYTLAFAFAWSSVGNLGIIARQRVQVLPFLLIFLCWSPVVTRTESKSSPDTFKLKTEAGTP